MKSEAGEFRDENIKAFEYTGTQYMLYDDVIKLCELCRKELMQLVISIIHSNDISIKGKFKQLDLMLEELEGEDENRT